VFPDSLIQVSTFLYVSSSVSANSSSDVVNWHFRPLVWYFDGLAGTQHPQIKGVSGVIDDKGSAHFLIAVLCRELKAVYVTKVFEDGVQI